MIKNVFKIFLFPLTVAKSLILFPILMFKLFLSAMLLLLGIHFLLPEKNISSMLNFDFHSILNKNKIVSETSSKLDSYIMEKRNNIANEVNSKKEEVIQNTIGYGKTKIISLKDEGIMYLKNNPEKIKADIENLNKYLIVENPISETVIGYLK